MDKFLETYSLPELSEEETEDLEQTDHFCLIPTGFYQAPAWTTGRQDDRACYLCHEQLSESCSPRATLLVINLSGLLLLYQPQCG